jgi:spore maturation protein CgeB
VRIGIVGPTDPDSFADNIGHSLIRMGHSVNYLGPAKPVHRSRIASRASDVARQAYPRYESRLHMKLAHRAVDARPDAVITTDSNLAPEAVALLRRHRINVGLWYPDHVANLGRMRILSAPYTALFFKDRLLVQRIRDTLGQPAWYLPEACNPEWHRPIGDAGTDKHIVVVGNTYLSRLMLLKRLHEDGIPLKIYGGPSPRWAPRVLPDACHAGRSVHKEEKARIFRRSAGVLNNLHPAEMTSVNARLFEATGAGAAVLCEDRSSLGEHYEVGREVIAFARYDELVEQCRELLENSARVADIGDAASKRAHAEHSYEVRLQAALEKLS